MHTKTLFVFLVAVLSLLLSFGESSPTPELIDSRSGTLDLETTERNNLIGRTDGANVAGFAAAGGYVNYNAPDGQQRAQGAEALINREVVDTVPGSTPMPGICPTGWSTIPGPNSKSRCHLIANTLSGSGKDERNLVTCYQAMNSPVMRHYEARVKRLILTFPTTGPWRRDKGVKHRVTPHYQTNLYPHQLEIKSELYMSGQFVKVLQWLTITNAVPPTVQFLCDGDMPQDGPPSLPAGNIITSNTPC